MQKEDTKLTSNENARGIIDKDSSIWMVQGADAAMDIVRWFGWLTAPMEFQKKERIEPVKALKEGIGRDGITNIVVLGTGGSGLGIRTYAQVFGRDNLIVVDLEAPQEIRNVIRWVDEKGWDKTVFVVSSKSWGTLETRNQEAIFRQLLAEKIGADKVARYFVAITDEGKMRPGEEAGFRAVFTNNYKTDAGHGMEIGGRYSSDSYFSMVPAILAGIPHDELLKNAEDEYNKFAAQKGKYIGMQIAEILDKLQKEGRNKVTFILDKGLEPFGAWVEQLENESIGKIDNSVVFVTGEEFSEDISIYGNDRAFIKIIVDKTESLKVTNIKGIPMLDLRINNIADINRLQYRFKIAITALAQRMNVHPFDQPAVEGSKRITKRLLDSSLDRAQLAEKLDAAASKYLKKKQDGAAIYYKGRTEEAIGIDVTAFSPAAILGAFLGTIETGDVVSISAYTHSSPEFDEAISCIRSAIRGTLSAHPSTLFGYGSRNQHSVNQAKSESDVFLEIQFTFDAPRDMDIPGKNYTLLQENMAHALGTVSALEEKNRRVIRMHFSNDYRQNPEKIKVLFETALQKKALQPR